MVATLSVRPFSLDLARPLTTARGAISTRDGFLVAVEDDDTDIVGVGEATPLPGWTESYGACAAGLDEVTLDGWDGQLTGLPAASHGLQSALLDATARSGERSLSAHLTHQLGVGSPATAVPVNATVGDGDVEATVSAARDAAESGYETLKLKVGARSLSADLERVRAVTSAVEAAVRLDVNGAWTRTQARDAVAELAELDVEYVEQPLPADDLSGHADLRGRGVEVALDESVASEEVPAVLDAGAADVVVLKPMALGGPGAAAGVARHLRSNGVDPVVTTTIDGAVARAAAVHVAATVPDVRACGLATGDRLREDLCPDPAPVSDGHVPVPDGPGVFASAGSLFDDR